ncbi:MAG: SCP-2 sterol transfer family protein [Lachnospiraceae bacterium]|nr:SCP-2 sterol transfer family protein [Lachnospiraceae bacterium]
MTFMEIVETVRGIYENADARNIYEHIAVQVDIVGEGSGSLYVEVAERSVCVEPYDYKDRDILVVTDGDTVNRIAHADISLEEAIKEGSFRVYGNKAKIELMKRIVV